MIVTLDTVMYILQFVSETFLSHIMRDVLVDLPVSPIGCVNMDEPLDSPGSQFPHLLSRLCHID